MDWNSGGSEDPPVSPMSPPRSPMSPRTIGLLTPTSQKILNNLYSIGEESDGENFSVAELSLLSREVNKLVDSFHDDSEIIEEANFLSQSISQIMTQKANRSKPNKTKLQFKYNHTDLGPFMVIIESKSTRNIGNIHPMNLAKKLNTLNYKGIKNISKRGKNRISLEFDFPDKANNFLKENPFVNDPDIDVFIPARMVSSKGVIKYVGSEITKEDIINHAESKVKILDARQLNRRITTEGVVSYVPSNTWILTFQGKNLPDRIVLWGCMRHVTLYVGPVIQCYNCLRYGHTKVNCSNPVDSKRCRNCASNHNEGECPDPNNPKCVFCSGKHASTDRNCPEFLRQKKINNLIAVENISYFEAVKLIPKTYNVNLSTQDNYSPSQQLRSQLFPQLPSRATNTIEDSTIVSVHNRRTLLNSRSTSAPSYSAVLGKKRRKNPQSPGYDHDLHDSQLLNISLPLSPIVGNKQSTQSAYDFSSDKTPLDSDPSISDNEILSLISKRLMDNKSSELLNNIVELLKNIIPQSPETNNIPSTPSTSQ